MSWLKKVDHITYAVAHGQIERWASFHLAIGGGTLVTRIDDVNPTSPRSSMRLWCIRYEEFGIALVEGIDREEVSQVSAFVAAHGDHSTQHIAYAVEDLDAFVQRLQDNGLRLRGEMVTRTDGFGAVKQVFTKGFCPGDAATTMFFEFIERPAATAAVTFSKAAGMDFYQQIEHARVTHDDEAFIDFTCFRGFAPTPVRSSGRP